jgi:hypothetical protein
MRADLVWSGSIVSIIIVKVSLKTHTDTAFGFVRVKEKKQITQRPAYCYNGLKAINQLL